MLAMAGKLSRKNGIIFLGLWTALAAAVLPMEVLISRYEILDFVLFLALLAGINILLGASLNLVNGWTGQFSLGHAGFMATGAYASAFLSVEFGSQFTTSPFGVHAFFLFCIVAGGIAAGLAGYLVGLPSLRLKGDYLAIVTLGFSEIIRVVLLNIPAVGGARGYINIPRHANLFWVGSWVLVTLYVLYRLHESKQGREWRAVENDEIATEALGISTTRTKVSAFILSSFFAGIAGGLFAHHVGYLNPSSFSLQKTTDCLIMVVLGGTGSLTGSVIAAVLVTLLPEALRELEAITLVDVRMVVYSALLIVLMLVRPQGLLGRSEVWQWLHRKR